MFPVPQKIIRFGFGVKINAFHIRSDIKFYKQLILSIKQFVLPELRRRRLDKLICRMFGSVDIIVFDAEQTVIIPYSHIQTRRTDLVIFSEPCKSPHAYTDKADYAQYKR